MDPWQIIATLSGVISTIAVVFWRFLLSQLADARAQRDQALGLLETSLENNRDAIAAWKARDHQDGARRRIADGDS